MAKLRYSDLVIISGDAPKSPMAQPPAADGKEPVIPPELRDFVLTVLKVSGLPATRGGLRELQRRYEQDHMNFWETMYRISGIERKTQ